MEKENFDRIHLWILCIFTPAWVEMIFKKKLASIFINNSKLLLPRAQITYRCDYE